MKTHDLTEHIQLLDSFKKDLKTIENNKEHFFYNGLMQEMDQESLDLFEKIKNWKLIYAFEDACSYAKELAIVLKGETEYGVINYYNAGQSITTNLKIYIASDKEELKELFEHFFIFNGRDDIQDKRINPRFDFNSIIDNFPDLKSN